MRLVDSDVVVLATHYFPSLGLSKLWVCFGSGSKVRDIHIHLISAKLGPTVCMVLPLFHSITGCDTVSHLLGCGKKTAWSAWQNTPGLTETFLTLVREPHAFHIDFNLMRVIERFVVVMFSKSCGLDRVNEARVRLFTMERSYLMLSHQHKQLYTSTPAELYYKPSTSGDRQQQLTKIYLIFLTGAGGETSLVFGCRFGRHWKTAARPLQF